MTVKAEPFSPEQQCPHCQQENRCAIAAGQAAADCWCMSASIDPVLAEHYRDQQRCLCQRCGSQNQEGSP